MRGMRLAQIFRADPEVVRYAAQISVWGRWFIWLVGIVMLARRPELWYPEELGFLFLSAFLAAVNGVVHHRLLTRRPVTRRWLLALSAIDVMLITANIIVSGRFDNFIFITYYPALAIFAVVFSSLLLVVVWVTATAAAYSLTIFVGGPGLDFGAGQEHVLAARLSVMYLVTVGISLVVGFERSMRIAATKKERQAHRKRVELSQEIHDTTAQTAYMISLGLEGALELAGDENAKLKERIAATAVLSKSVMWELRRPIDMGRILEGDRLSRVLEAYIATFARITSVPAELVQSGQEPPLPEKVKSGLFSIAHNALTNAFWHARAAKVEVGLHFEPSRIRLYVTDDGVGLPADYAERGRGFCGMEKEARNIGGTLIVSSEGLAAGTSITCLVLYPATEM